jgi:formylglycine-generating enzyme required for sulfatase activity
LIRQLARLQPVRKIPRIPRLTWSPEARVLVDRRPPLALFRTEFEQRIRRLRRQRGRSGLYCMPVDEPPDLSPGDAPVLVLSDLGCLDQNAIVRDGWREFAARRKWRRTRPTALMPCPKSRWDTELCRLWSCHVWDRGHRLRHPPQPPAAHDPEVMDDHAERVERLLSLLSPAIRIEPALLRGARLLLPPHRADVGTEFDAWFHQDAQRTPEAMAIRTPAALRRRGAFAEFDEATKRSMIELIRYVHRHWSPSFFARETITLHECGAPVTRDDVELAWKILRRFNKTMFQMLVDEPARARQLRLFEWQQSDFGRSSPAARAAPETAVAWELGRAWRREQAAVVPDDIDHEVVKQTQKLLLVEHAKLAVWQVARVGSRLVVTRSSDALAGGSPAALIPAISPRFDVLLTHEEAQRSVVNLLPRPQKSPVHVAATDARHVVMRSDRGQLELLPIQPPEWASRFGWDRFGLFAEFEVGDVAFPLRWIPPGEFDMGSPEDEPGRWNVEGPRHRVTIGRGFWLATTPVTQAQYAAVTGQRPSRFKNAGDQAPVEQVIWDDCRKFCDELKKKIAESDKESKHKLTFRLPSEAEWEYACRAGTTSALYTGPLTIKGENNGPELDAIAWYGGNSGVDYEGAQDSSGGRRSSRTTAARARIPSATKQP